MSRPVIQTKQAAGADLVASETVTIPPKHRAVVGTGYVYDIEACSLLRGRSGLAFKQGITAHEGTIDADYRKEVKVLLFNHNDVPFTIVKGSRIAQLVVIDALTSTYFDTKEVDRVCGFGSTNAEEVTGGKGQEAGHQDGSDRQDKGQQPKTTGRKQKTKKGSGKTK